MNIKRMVLGVVALAALAGLGGCATLQDVINDIGTVAQTNIVNPVNDAQVTQIGNALGVANAVVVGYAALPLCAPGHALTAYDICHDKTLLATLAADMHLARTAYGQLVAFQTAHPTGSTVVGGGFSALLAQAKGALATIKQLIAAYHVGGN